MTAAWASRRAGQGSIVIVFIPIDIDEKDEETRVDVCVGTCKSERRRIYVSIRTRSRTILFFPLCPVSPRRKVEKDRTVSKRAQESSVSSVVRIYSEPHIFALFFLFFQFSEMNRFTYPAVDLESLCLLGGSLGGKGTSNGNRGLFV